METLESRSKTILVMLVIIIHFAFDFKRNLNYMCLCKTKLVYLIENSHEKPLNTCRKEKQFSNM